MVFDDVWLAINKNFIPLPLNRTAKKMKNRRIETIYWFEADLYGCETKYFWMSLLRNIKHQGSKKEHRHESKEDALDVRKVEEGQQSSPGPLVTHVNNILHSISKYTTLTVWTNTSSTLPKTSRQLFPKKGASNCKGYDYGVFFDDNLEALLSKHFFTRIKVMHSKLDGFMFFGRLGIHFFSPFEKL